MQPGCTRPRTFYPRQLILQTCTAKMTSLEPAITDPLGCVGPARSSALRLRCRFVEPQDGLGTRP
jgi:hypothetical protein